MFLALVVLGCTGGKSDTGVVFHPAVSFLAPTDGSTLPAGTVQVSILLDDFVIGPPESARAEPLPVAAWLLEGVASAHNETGEPTGFCTLLLDGTKVADMDTTQYSLADVPAGAHALEGHLYFADGDDPDPTPVDVTIHFTAE